MYVCMHVCMYVSVHVSKCSNVYCRCTYPFTYLAELFDRCVDLSIYLPVRLYFYHSSFHQSMHQSTDQLINQSLCPFKCESIYLSTIRLFFLSAYLSILGFHTWLFFEYGRPPYELLLLWPLSWSGSMNPAASHSHERKHTGGRVQRWFVPDRAEIPKTLNPKP